MYQMDPNLVNEIQSAHDLSSLKTAALNVMDTLLVDIINSDTRRERNDEALQNELGQLRRRVEQLEFTVDQLQRQVRGLT